jgi:Lhr-like helicase
LLRGVRAVVVDEWHELLASKRGVQVELALDAPVTPAQLACHIGADARAAKEWRVLFKLILLDWA